MWHGLQLLNDVYGPVMWKMWIINCPFFQMWFKSPDLLLCLWNRWITHFHLIAYRKFSKHWCGTFSKLATYVTGLIRDYLAIFTWHMWYYSNVRWQLIGTLYMRIAVVGYLHIYYHFSMWEWDHEELHACGNNITSTLHSVPDCDVHTWCAYVHFLLSLSLCLRSDSL